MHPRRLLLAAAVAALCVVAVPSVANAAPCWQRVISDWTKDGKIDGHYSPHCLRQAYKNTPEDLRDYSGILDDINAALIAAGSTQRSGGGNSGNGNGPVGGNSVTNGPNSPAATAAAKKREATRRAKVAKQAVPGAGTEASAPGHDRSIPLPLILLGAVIAAGAAAGAAPGLFKRYRTRFPRLRPSPGSVRPPA